MITPVNKRAALIVATLTSFLTPFAASSINIALPAISAEFSMNAIEMSWVATAYLLASAMFILPFGRLADIYGRKRIFTCGMLLYAVAALLLGITPIGALIIPLRMVQGIGGAMIFGTGIAILTSLFPAKERGRVFGLNVAAVYIGLTLGPTLGGFLTQQLGWRSVFWTNVPIAIIVLLIIVIYLKGEWGEAAEERFDWVGSLIFGLAFPLFIYGFTLLPRLIGAGLVLAGTAGLAGFVIWEMRVKSPILDIFLFKKNPVFAYSNLACLLNYSASAALTFLLSLYLQYIKGLDPQSAGLVLISQPIVMAIFSPLAGRLSDRFEPRIVSSLGMGLTTVGLFIFAFLEGGTGLFFISCILVLIGLGFALFSSPNTNAVMSSVPPKYYGVAAATLGTMRLSGQMISMAIAMLILTLYIGGSQITPHNHPQFLKSNLVIFLIMSGLCLVGVFASLARGNVRSDNNRSI